MSAQVNVLVGTRKGAFIYTSDEKRQRWQVSEPMMPGWQIFHIAADARSDPPRLYAAANHSVWGPSVAKSADGGKTWDWRSEGLGFPQDMDLAIDAIWHVRPGHKSQPGVVFAGASPAGLFRSEDDGVSWAPVDSINRHQLRPYWGAGEPAVNSRISAHLALHSIEIDPRDASHMYLTISGGGSYVALDGGDRWQLFSHRAVAQTPEAREMAQRMWSDFERQFVSQRAANVPPGIDPLAVFDMHRLRLDPKNPDRLWAQAHTGVFRSDNGGRSWEDTTGGLPSFHGFPIAITRREPDAVYVVPLEVGTGNFRVSPGQFAVYRTRNSGASWERLTDGLPGPDDYQSAYREGMDTDGLEPEGVYVGTSNGQVFASSDGGDHWQRLPGTLPPVLSVTCAVY